MDVLPKPLLRELQSRGESVVPGLIEILRAETENASKGITIETNGACFAFSLLSAIGDARALPAVIDAISLPQEAIHSLLGDLIHDDLQRLIVKLIGTDFNQIGQLIENQDLYEYVRWSLACTYFLLFRRGRLSREEGAERLERHLNRLIEFPCDELNAGLCMELANFGMPASLETIRRAYASGMVSEGIVSQEEVEETLNGFDENSIRGSDEMPPLEFDVAEELSGWACFQPTNRPNNSVPQPSVTKPQAVPISMTTNDAPRPAPRPPVGTIRNTDKTPGRNDPCSCGSGKKYKNCCRLKSRG
ncbi:preprotein translocase subunit SecA [Stieleria magnilauensis]|uniref:Preprotein translocase subunit SecA n=1 Tax=Stieleria magnilauensis TaxID=2527963 RepID=A0ABX5XV00_9BACT|nr:preprotein translocase subunit SecA [Planctomycetes bacterium TBK1r]